MALNCGKEENETEKYQKKNHLSDRHALHKWFFYFSQMGIKSMDSKMKTEQSKTNNNEMCARKLYARVNCISKFYNDHSNGIIYKT